MSLRDEEPTIPSPAAVPSRSPSHVPGADQARDETIGPCRLCGARSWSVLFEGPIRQGKYGNVTATPRKVLQCGGCGAGMLEAADRVDYESSEYRDLVDGDASPERYYALHDAEQPAKLAILGAEGVRGKVVADIGCGAGSFLNLIKGSAATTIGIEPSRSYHQALTSKGHAVFPFCADAAAEWRGRVDVAVSFSVIEHLDDPAAFLREARTLLRPGGTMLVSTPNLRDWMLELLPQEYGSFFYRTVHSWYFDVNGLGVLARAAGFSSCDVRSVHRFDLSNALLWLRDRRPTGLGAVPVSPAVNATFVQWLEAGGRADYLYATLRA
ncbi:MAG: class I SAM-dependent methyltransferase [Gemmatimonadales bacterium]